jgi:outer membrane protein OmpA-like peptidoglycan-associated protein
MSKHEENLMIRTRKTAFHSVLVASVFGAQQVFANTGCPEENAQLAMQAADLTSVSAIYEQVEFNPDCSNTLRTAMRNSLAALHAAAAETETGHVKITHLKEALRLGPTWEYQVALGETLMGRKDYAQAAKHLQEAINRLNDNPTEGAIDKDAALRLVRLASTAMALAETEVEVPSTRSGNTGGIFAKSVRGFQVVEVDVPVTFKFDSTEFTVEGEKLAAKMADAIIQQAPASITLEGHTDPQGSDQYNMNLSQGRAEALRTYLVQRGFTGTVNVIGRGETEPPQIDAALNLDQEQIFELARRVELIR